MKINPLMTVIALWSCPQTNFFVRAPCGLI